MSTIGFYLRFKNVLDTITISEEEEEEEESQSILKPKVVSI
jgi:hypothetical protein